MHSWPRSAHLNIWGKYSNFTENKIDAEKYVSAVNLNLYVPVGCVMFLSCGCNSTCT